MCRNEMRPRWGELPNPNYTRFHILTPYMVLTSGGVALAVSRKLFSIWIFSLGLPELYDTFIRRHQSNFWNVSIEMQIRHVWLGEL